MTPGDITRLLEAAGAGDRSAFDSLYRSVYDELHRMARTSMQREGAGHTLQPTALVHEAYLRLAPNSSWEDRRHFFGAAAEAMRRILVDHARRRLAEKRGADFERVTLADAALDLQGAQKGGVDVLQLDRALERLRAESPRLADLVNLRFFAGLSIADAARAMQISPATAKRDWAFARAWLRQQMAADAT
jgi:RNA polymerase sigma factor (TIGR02999 family)